MIDLDVRFFLYLHDRFSQGGWLAFMGVLTVIGSGWGALMIVPLFASPRTRPFAASLTAALSVTSIVVFVLKAVVQRKRPYLVVPNVHARLFEAPTDFSFPSGHAAGSFAFAVFVAVVLVRHAIYEPEKKKRRLALSGVAMIAALGIAMSRCVLGVHFPLDVFAGGLLGSALGALGACWHLRRMRLSARSS